MPLRPLLLHRYVVREFVPPFAVSLLVFTFLMVVNHLFLMMDLFLNRGVEAATLFKMTLLILPTFLPMSVPMAALLATLLCYGRFSEDGELIAFRSGGLTLLQYGGPTLAVGAALSLVLVCFNLSLAPRAAREFKNIHYAVASKNPLALFSAGVMNHLGDYKIIVQKIDRRKQKLEGVSIYKLNPEGGPTRILAPEGNITSDSQSLTLRLLNGTLHQPSQGQARESQYTISKFQKYALRIPARMQEAPRAVAPRELTYLELQARIEEALRAGLNPAGLRTERDSRVAIAFSPVAFTLLGIVLGTRFKKGSRSIGVGLSLVVIMVYYGLSVFFLSLSAQGLLPAVLLTWCPNLVALALGAVLWRRLARL